MRDWQFRSPQLEDRELIDGYFKKYPSRNCDRTFANVYLWARHYNVKFALIDETLVFFDNSEGYGFAYPLGEPEHVKDVIKELEAYSKEHGKEFLLYGIDANMFAQIESWYPGEYEIEYDRDMADYVYESEKLCTLAGKKLHGKRNHINKFKLTYPDWSYEPITDENREECFQMALRWRTANGCNEDAGKNAEMCVTLNALRLQKELELQGGILRCNGDIVAFTLGEAINDDTFVVHIEKAYADVPGAYTMINQQFVEHVGIRYPYINREDDSGQEGLRKAKLSYKPAFLVEKGVVRRKRV